MAILVISLPMPLIKTVFVPFFPALTFNGMLKHTTVWSAHST
jgi:hypothetical protein